MDGDADVGTGGGTQYPNYADDEATFAQFVREHKILTEAPQRRRNARGNSNNNNSNADDDSDSDNDDSDEDGLLEPTAAGGRNLIQRRCYAPLLQRIKDRHYFDADELPQLASSAENARAGGGGGGVAAAGGTATTTPTSRTFVIEVPLKELIAWDAVRGGDLAQRASRNTVRYQELFCKVMDDVLNEMQPSGGDGGGNNGNDNSNRDSLDVLQEQRLAQQAAREANAQQQPGGADAAAGADQAGNLANDDAVQNGTGPTDPFGATEDFPPLLMRRYELRVLPVGRKGVFPPFMYQRTTSSPSTASSDTEKSHQQNLDNDGVSLREIRSRSIGRLVTIRGMIVRCSDVKPACVVATYTCDACGCEIYQVVQNKREFMPQRVCPSEACRAGRTGTTGMDTLHLQTRGSKFVKFQELKLQELPSQVPMGHIPRSLSVHVRGELTRITSPGDVVTIDGVFLPQRVAESGYRAMKAGLISTTFLEAQNIRVHKKSYDESVAEGMSEEERAILDGEVMAVATGEDPVGSLSSAIAPEIWGHDDIKRALLLMLVGGCTRKLPDGMRIRGDINICLMGDPGVAKSQLLKHVASIAPRGVYTTGKGSSGVGLTAAVTKDVTTGEMALEGGALVLADQGICAIDEFDKMDESDRTAIHEVMEQQTVSIAKAGIVATLNARAAVLAAANPLYGRYNRHKSLSENINLPNSLLSRFDLMFLILDIADVDRDMALARHVTFVHQNEGLESAQPVKDKSKSAGDIGGMSDDDDDDDMEDDSVGGTENQDKVKKTTVTSRILREYITRARKHQPIVPPDVAPYIVEAYVGLRMQDAPGTANRGSANGDQTVMTARQLLSILRLGQALARLRFSDYVAREDVDEAIRLTHMSKASLADELHDAPQGGGGQGGGSRAGGRSGRGEDVTSRIFQVLKDYATVSRTNRVELKLCEAMVLRKGFTAQQLQTCLEEYQALDIIQMNATGTHIDFLGDTH